MWMKSRSRFKISSRQTHDDRSKRLLPMNVLTKSIVDIVRRSSNTSVAFSWGVHTAANSMNMETNWPVNKDFVFLSKTCKVSKTTSTSRRVFSDASNSDPKAKTTHWTSLVIHPEYTRCEQCSFILLITSRHSLAISMDSSVIAFLHWFWITQIIPLTSFPSALERPFSCCFLWTFKCGTISIPNFEAVFEPYFFEARLPGIKVLPSSEMQAKVSFAEELLKVGHTIN